MEEADRSREGFFLREDETLVDRFAKHEQNPNTKEFFTIWTTGDGCKREQVDVIQAFGGQKTPDEGMMTIPPNNNIYTSQALQPTENEASKNQIEGFTGVCNCQSTVIEGRIRVKVKRERLKKSKLDNNFGTEKANKNSGWQDPIKKQAGDTISVFTALYKPFILLFSTAA
ncbi:hypothetical protein LXL04_026369 [Taraxacum kok-saghyz]